MFTVWGDSGNARGDNEADVAELAQFLHYTIDLLCMVSLRIENRLSIVKNDENLLGG